MEAVANKSFDKSIIYIKIYKKYLIIVDNESTVRFINKETLNAIQGFKVHVTHEFYKNQVVAFSSNLKYFGVANTKTKDARLYNLKTKKLIGKIDRNQGVVSTVEIDPLSRYFFVGGEDGKTFVMDTKSRKLAIVLPPHPDTINDIACSADGIYVATASYDRKISLFNLSSMTPVKKLVAHSAAVIKLLFLKDHKLISVDKNDTIIVWDLRFLKVLVRLKGAHDEVRDIAVDSKEKFLFVATTLGYIIVFDLEKHEMLHHSFLKLSFTITKIEIDKATDFLYIATEEGELFCYNIYQYYNELKSYITEKKIDDIPELLKRNPLLQYTSLYNSIDKMWEISYQKAKEYLEDGKVEKAKALLKRFEKIPQKKRFIQKLFEEFTPFHIFKKYILEQRYALAYAMLPKYPLYKETKIFKQLELKWKKSFAIAQKYALSPMTAQKAKELLMPFSTIPEKSIYIKDMMQKLNVYKLFREALANKNMAVLAKLIDENEYLKELPEYDSLMKYLLKLHEHALKSIQKKQFLQAKSSLKMLLPFKKYNEEVKELLIEVDLLEKFYDSLQRGDLARSYEIMNKLDTIRELPEGEKLHKKWEEHFERAKLFAATGDIKAIKEELQEYLTIKVKFQAIATLFSLAYIVQLENALKEKVKCPTIQKAIKRYISLFGLTEQIEFFYYEFHQHCKEFSIDLKSLKRGSFESWTPAMIVNSILEA